MCPPARAGLPLLDSSPGSIPNMKLLASAIYSVPLSFLLIIPTVQMGKLRVSKLVDLPEDWAAGLAARAPSHPAMGFPRQCMLRNPQPQHIVLQHSQGCTQEDMGRGARWDGGPPSLRPFQSHPLLCTLVLGSGASSKSRGPQFPQLSSARDIPGSNHLGAGPGSAETD